MDAQELDRLWQSYQLRVTDEIVRSPEVLFCNGSAIGTLGNFSASTGKAKSKKTFNVSAILAAALTNGEVLRYIAEFPDDKRTILYFDTEQSPHHCQRVMKRALRLAGLPVDRHPENLIFAQLRAITPDLRLELIDNAIANTPNVGLVIIDGIRDLMFDINNAIESSRLIGKLMEWTDKYQIHIHTVLHLNKSDDNVRGHVGTELNNKAETVLQVCKSTTDSEVTEVSASCIRSMDFPLFAFIVNEAGVPEIAADYTFVGKTKVQTFSYSELTPEQHRQALEKAFANGAIKGCQNCEDSIKRAYAACGFPYGDGKVTKLNSVVIANKIIPASNNCGNVFTNKIPPSNTHVIMEEAKLTTGTNALRIFKGAYIRACCTA